MLRVLAVLAAFGLLVYAFTDFASSDEEDRGDIPRWLWLVIIVLLPYFGPISWITFSRSRRAQARRGSAPRSPARPGSRGRTRRRNAGPVAPDDDPDFLWRLAQEQRRQARYAEGSDGTRPDAMPTDDTTRKRPKGAAGPDDDTAPEDPSTDEETRDDERPA